jgi:hypothetical protein
MTPPAVPLRVEFRGPIATRCRETAQAKNMLRRYRKLDSNKDGGITHDR